MGCVVKPLLLHNLCPSLSQGARDLAGTPTLAEIVQGTLEEAKAKEKQQEEEEEEETESGESKRGLKRKLDSQECSEVHQGEGSKKENGQSPKELGKLNKAKNVGFSFWLNIMYLQVTL